MRSQAKAPSAGSSKRHPKLLVGLAAALALTLALGVTLASAVAPVVSIEDAANVSYTSADVKGTVNPEGQSTAWRFQYITDAQFQDNLSNSLPGFEGATTGIEESTEAEETLERQLSGLTPNTTYHLRLQAENADGQSEAVASSTFTTDEVQAPALSDVETSDVSYVSAKAGGKVEVANADPAFNASCYFEYIPDATYQENLSNSLGGFEGASSESCTTEASGPGSTDVEAQLQNLKPGTVYRLRLVATNAGGTTSEEAAATFETDPVALPIVSIDPITEFDEGSATFKGEVDPAAPPANPPAFDVNWHFECEPGCPGDLSGVVPAGPDPVTVEVDAKGLQPNTEYKVKLVASNAGGQSETPQQSFKTDALAPVVGNVAYSDIGVAGSGQVALGGLANPRNLALSDCHFEFGPTAGYGQSVPCEALPPTNNELNPVRAELSGLTPGATYHFRLSVTNASGTVVSDDDTFVPSQAPAEQCANTTALGASHLPNCRAWEMVSPPAKEGGDLLIDSRRTRAADDGSAVAFSSLRAFADAMGTGIASDYMAQRSTDPNPGHNGWSTHALIPYQEPLPVKAQKFPPFEPRYVGDFSPDLSAAVFNAWSPVTDEDPNVTNVPNLYRRTDLRTPGAGTFDLLTACPFCAEGDPDTPLALPEFGALAEQLKPLIADSSPSLDHVIFESKQRLTGDTPLQGPGLSRLYSWEDGVTRLAGRIPTAPEIACDDAGAPACTAADVSIAGVGAGSNHGYRLTKDTVSDGSDGRSRIFFTRPTEDGISVRASGIGSERGNIYMRLDHRITEQLNASERTVSTTGFSPAAFQGASEDGTRVFFTTSQPLTDDTRAASGTNLYMYDATKPGSAPDNLTLVSVDAEPEDEASVQRFIGASDDGTWAYFTATGQLVAGQPLLGNGNNGRAIYVWHEGVVRYVGRSPVGGDELSIGSDSGWILAYEVRQARVAPDGRHLLFGTITGSGVLSAKGGVDYDHGGCDTNSGIGCRELYLYDAEADTLECASCNPSGAPATSMATTVVREQNGGAQSNFHETNALSADGRYVFFSTAERLVSEDRNGQIDAYAYDSATNEPRLLSSGESPQPSYFMEASADGTDAFILTAERLSNWDFDNSRDLYDARVNGGFPEPPPSPPSCQGDACQPAPADLNDATPGSSVVTGPGDPQTRRVNSRRCPRGKQRVKQRNGKARCVKRTAQRKRNGKRDANTNRRAGR